MSSGVKGLNYQFSLHHSYIFFLNGWENLYYELRSERVKLSILTTPLIHFLLGWLGESVLRVLMLFHLICRIHKFMDYVAKDIVGMSAYDFYHGSDVALIQQHHAKCELGF